MMAIDNSHLSTKYLFPEALSQSVGDRLIS